MSATLSISLTNEQAAYVNWLVEEGHFPSLSPVMQEAVELMRQQNEIADTLSQLLEERRAGDVERQPPWPLPTTKLAGFDRCVLR